MTDRIYYHDAYCRLFDATVTRALVHDGRPAAILDRTAFYPTSGGQPFDIGRLGAARVEETIERRRQQVLPGVLLHVVEASAPVNLAGH